MSESDGSIKQKPKDRTIPSFDRLYPKHNWSLGRGRPYNPLYDKLTFTPIDKVNPWESSREEIARYYERLRKAPIPIIDVNEFFENENGQRFLNLTGIKKEDFNPEIFSFLNKIAFDYWKLTEEEEQLKKFSDPKDGRKEEKKRQIEGLKRETLKKWVSYLKGLGFYNDQIAQEQFAPNLEEESQDKSFGFNQRYAEALLTTFTQYFSSQTNTDRQSTPSPPTK